MKLKRATTLEEFAALPPLITKEGYAAGLALQLQPTDVVITPYAKSGTTWMQQLVHTLRTGGDMDFDDISRVVPWIEASTDLGLDLNAAQRAHPRAFKSHLAWDDMPRGGRYINVVRDPGDAAVSAFKFMEGWFIEPGTVDMDTFVQQRFCATRNYFKHLASWWPRRHDEDVLFLAFEHMLDRPQSAIEQVAAFIEIPLDDDLLALAIEYTHVDFMLEYKDRFDDALMRTRSEQDLGLPPGGDSAKVRRGKSGEKQTLSQATRQLILDIWAEEIATPFGLNTYTDMLTTLASEAAAR